MKDSQPKDSHRPFVAILLAIVALGGTSMLMERSRESDRQLLEFARVSMDRERMERELALQEMRYLDSQEQRAAASERQRFSSEEYRRTRERAEVDQWRNQVDAQIRYTERAERENQAIEARAFLVRRYAEVLSRQQDNRDRQIAQADVERQNRWVRQREYEEERARHDRHYRLQAEETQRRYERSRDEYLRLRAHGM